MRFCQQHWDRLREAIESRGLGHLIAADGETAAAQMADQLRRAEAGEDPGTPVNYDPLMSAHWAIANNVMQTISQAGGNPLYLMGDGDEDPVEGYGPSNDGRTWPRCPLCYLNLAHELTCTDKRCTLDQKHGYDWMIDRAADDAGTHVAKLRESPKPIDEDPSA